MKMYEIGRLLAEPVLPPIYKHVRARLRQLQSKATRPISILDVGGRKSPYTIGLNAQITVIDLPRESEIQQSLNLGVTQKMAGELKTRRSNLSEVILGDMTNSDLSDASFDVVVSVEVLEHVEEDDRFVSEVSRVLKPGGTFLMTTPNGDWVVNRNPDHKRHYRKDQLSQLLNAHFNDVSIDYAIAGGKFRKMGLKSWELGNPSSIGLSIVGNIVNSIQSSSRSLRHSAHGTHHLIAVARKSD
jgi:SAM-dependent methyltransferase